MKMLIPLVLAVAASASWVTDSSSYSFYVFTVEWKPSICQTQTCVSGYYSEAFNIHGLWPSTSASNGPEDCTNADFTVSSSVQQELETCWLSYSGTPQSFWEHEWSKHGTCMSPAMTCDAYFLKVVSLYNQYDPLSTLASAGVTPSNDKTYTLSQLYGAFSNKVNVQCSGKYLTVIMQCLDLDFNPMDCDEVSSGCTDGEFLFPSSD